MNWRPSTTRRRGRPPERWTNGIKRIAIKLLAKGSLEIERNWRGQNPAMDRKRQQDSGESPCWQSTVAVVRWEKPDRNECRIAKFWVSVVRWLKTSRMLNSGNFNMKIFEFISIEKCRISSLTSQLIPILYTTSWVSWNVTQRIYFCELKLVSATFFVTVNRKGHALLTLQRKVFFYVNLMFERKKKKMANTFNRRSKKFIVWAKTNTRVCLKNFFLYLKDIRNRF